MLKIVEIQPCPHGWGCLVNKTYDLAIPGWTKLNPVIEDAGKRHKCYLQHSDEYPIVDIERLLVNPDALEVILANNYLHEIATTTIGFGSSLPYHSAT